MRADARRTRSALLGLVAALTGCGVSAFFRAEGDGGWTPERRSEEIARRSRAAGTVFAAPAETTPRSDEPLDLATVLVLASERNRPLAAARYRVEEARQDVRAARGLLFPSTVGSGRYTFYTDPQTNRIDLPSEPGSPAAVPPAVTIREDELGVLSGSLTLPIDVSGELRHALRAAQAGFRGEEARLWAVSLETQVEAVRAYFELLEARRLVEVARQTVALQKEQLANARRRSDAGRLTKNELLVVEVALRNSEQALLRRELARDRARWALNREIGLEIDAPTEVVDLRERPAVPPLEDALALAGERNPLLVSLLEERQQLEARLVSLRRSRLPRLTSGAAIDYSSSGVLEPNEIGSGFVGFTFDLGTDGRREAEIAKARIGVERNRVAIERQLRELEEVIRSSRRAAVERLAALDAAEAGVSQAEENLRIRQQQFDVGRATSEDVLDAERLLTGQRVERARAVYQARTRLAELHRWIGVDVAKPLPASRTADTEPPARTRAERAPPPLPGPVEPPAAIASPMTDSWDCVATSAGTRCIRETAPAGPDGAR